MGQARDLKSRLLRKIKVNPENFCWEWTAKSKTRDYGAIQVDGRSMLAHRVSYEIHLGAIPVGMNVCHRCDNPRCINPDHLFLGTQADNLADMFSKGREVRGAAHTNAKLTEADVIAIRSSRGLSQVNLAKQYGMSRVQIQRILAGERWAHVKEI